MMMMMMTFTLTISKCFVGFQRWTCKDMAYSIWLILIAMDMQPRGEDLSRTQVPFRRRLARRHRPRRGIGNGPALRRSAWGLRRRGTRGATAKKGTSGRSDHQMEKEKRNEMDSTNWKIQRWRQYVLPQRNLGGISWESDTTSLNLHKETLNHDPRNSIVESFYWW